MHLASNAKSLRGNVFTIKVVRLLEHRWGNAEGAILLYNGHKVAVPFSVGVVLYTTLSANMIPVGYYY